MFEASAQTGVQIAVDPEGDLCGAHKNATLAPLADGNVTVTVHLSGLRMASAALLRSARQTAESSPRRLSSLMLGTLADGLRVLAVERFGSKCQQRAQRPSMRERRV